MIKKQRFFLQKKLQANPQKEKESVFTLPQILANQRSFLGNLTPTLQPQTPRDGYPKTGSRPCLRKP